MKPENGESLDKRTRTHIRREGRLISQALRDRRHLHRSIHEGRKAIRRLRALLELLDTENSPELARVDRNLQRLGRSLSRLRDAHVAVETAELFARHGPSTSSNHVINGLIQRRDELVGRSLRRDGDFALRQSLLHNCMHVLDGLHWGEVSQRHLRDALHRSQRRATKAAMKARDAPSPEHIHRWRRRLRRLRMQLEILRDIAPSIVHGEGRAEKGRHVRELHKQSDRLGQLQDMEALRRLLNRMPATPERDVMLRRVDKEVDEAHGS